MTPLKAASFSDTKVYGPKRGGLTEALDLLAQINAGDETSREQLIQTYRHRIAGMASRICKRALDWDNDDELSIALLAFNEAIDTYQSGKGTAFTTHAYRVIQSRLIDHFRREKRFQHISLDRLSDEDEGNRLEQLTFSATYQAARDAEEQELSMGLFVDALNDFGISLAELVKDSPKHHDTRTNLIKAAQTLVNNSPLKKRFFATGQVPMKELVPATGLSRKVLENGRRYIVAVAIVLADDEFRFIRSFLTLPEETERRYAHG
ncbi:RNA polymerase sigma-I factor [Heliophilum fasciatum]|uniref:RNA polymerase sigma factor SigI n=1 Tax=Heliophilum fasciatum TaxID=35700 RepID=A0A4R2RZI4_9FIRM|nr:RNA polymerase sigma-I factor [Heliophilum fasciatum]MCW2276609.1 RNA polymerase sigma factor [Heliophilum fasciatum]TCP69008.1 RNA polymerase sigma factor [Heliophilum fasciatum]